MGGIQSLGILVDGAAMAEDLNLEFGILVKEEEQGNRLNGVDCSSMYSVGPWLVCFEFSLGD